jgi:hypothetical protein
MRASRHQIGEGVNGASGAATIQETQHYSQLPGSLFSE